MSKYGWVERGDTEIGERSRAPVAVEGDRGHVSVVLRVLRLFETNVSENNKRNKSVVFRHNAHTATTTTTTNAATTTTTTTTVILMFQK